LKVYDDIDSYLKERGQNSYLIYFVVEEENRSFIVASIKHNFSGSKDDGIFIFHKQLLGYGNIIDYHFSVHADGVCHLRRRMSGDPKHASKKHCIDLTSEEGRNKYFNNGPRNFSKIIVSKKLPPLKDIKEQTLVNNFSINIHETFKQEDHSESYNISKSAKYSDQVITLNRKYNELDQVYCNLWILPKDNSFRHTNRIMNPQVYIFNLLNPPIALELYSEIQPMSSIQKQGLYGEIKFRYQIQDPNSFFINFEPRLCDGGRTLYIPNWKLLYKGKEYELPELKIPLKDGLKLYIGGYNGSDYYHLDFIGAKIPPFDRKGPFCPSIVYAQGGEVNVLRGIKNS
jgi:hypothetical protein